MSYIGTNKIGGMYLGSTEIAKAYLGSNLVYQKQAGDTYTISQSLSHATSTNPATQIGQGQSYTTTLAVESFDYGNLTVIVTMGGEDITSSVYDSLTGVVLIASVSGNIGISATASFWNYAYRNIRYSCHDGGYADFGYGQANYMISPLFSVKDARSVTFSVGGTRIGDLVFFQDDGGYRSYYISNANPRTVSVGASYNLCAICFQISKLASTYVYDNTNGLYLFNGSELSSSQILEYDQFRTYSPLASAITWENSRGDLENWNFANSSSASSSGARNIYNPPIYRIVKTPTSTASEYQSVISKMVTLPKNYTDGKSYIEFSVGAVYSSGNYPLALFYNDNSQTASYFMPTTNPRTVTAGASYTTMRLLMDSSKYSSSYIKDAFTNTFLWKGSD